MPEKLWVEEYIRESESGERRKILEKAVADEGMTPENELRARLLEKRYITKDGQETDRFMHGWMTLSFMREPRKGLLAARRKQKDRETVRSDWALDLAGEYGETGRDVLYQEFVQLSRLYIRLCQKDSNYSAVFFGLGRMKEDNLNIKIAKDIYRVAYEAPEEAGLKEELALFTKAATDAFCEMYSREKDLLLSLIRAKQQDGSV